MPGEQTDDIETCIGCDKQMKPGDLFYCDVSGGVLHAACCGPERESYVNLDTGDPIGPDEPIPTPSVWEAP